MISDARDVISEWAHATTGWSFTPDEDDLERLLYKRREAGFAIVKVEQ